MSRVTRKEIIDAIIREAASGGAPSAPGLFTGDARDGKALPITLENFTTEMIRHGAIALRARLSRLSRAELDAELNAAAEYVTTWQKQRKEFTALAEQNERDNIARELSKRQAELARKPRLQPAILEAARYYRGLNRSAKAAWDAIKAKPYATRDGEIAMIESDLLVVRSLGRTQKRAGIKEAQWRNRYWRAAKDRDHAKPG
jgi:hypothetical protein